MLRPYDKMGLIGSEPVTQRIALLAGHGIDFESCRQPGASWQLTLPHCSAPGLATPLEQPKYRKLLACAAAPGNSIPWRA